jgi:hypothetical protein
MSELGQSGKATLLGPLTEGAPPLAKSVVLAKWSQCDNVPERVTIHTRGSDASVPAIVPPLTHQRCVTMFQARVTFGGDSEWIELDGTGSQALTVVAEAVELYAAWDKRAFDRMLSLSPGYVCLWSPVNDMAGALAPGPSSSVGRRTDYFAVELAPIPAGTTELLAPWAPLSILPSRSAGACAFEFFHDQTSIGTALWNPGDLPVIVPPVTTRALATPAVPASGPGMAFTWTYGLPNVGE